MGYNGPMKEVPPQICKGEDNKDRAWQCYVHLKQATMWQGYGS